MANIEPMNAGWGDAVLNTGPSQARSLAFGDVDNFDQIAGLGRGPVYP